MKRAARRAKIAFSIDAQLLERVERIRASTGESRSAVISRALAGLTAEERRGARIARYRQAYLDQPESEDELATAQDLARRALATLAWEDGR